MKIKNQRYEGNRYINKYEGIPPIVKEKNDNANDLDTGGRP